MKVKQRAVSVFHMGTVFRKALAGFIMYIHYEGRRESFNRDPAATLQLLCGDLISSRRQVYEWKHMPNVLPPTPPWPTLTHSISLSDEVWSVAYFSKRLNHQQKHISPSEPHTSARV